MATPKVEIKNRLSLEVATVSTNSFEFCVIQSMFLQSQSPCGQKAKEHQIALTWVVDPRCLREEGIQKAR